MLLARALPALLIWFGTAACSSTCLACMHPRGWIYHNIMSQYLVGFSFRVNRKKDGKSSSCDRNLVDRQRIVRLVLYTRTASTNHSSERRAYSKRRQKCGCAQCSVEVAETDRAGWCDARHLTGLGGSSRLRGTCTAARTAAFQRLEAVRQIARQN
jgi:hypothetical protein